MSRRVFPLLASLLLCVESVRIGAIMTRWHLLLFILLTALCWSFHPTYLGRFSLWISTVSAGLVLQPIVCGQRTRDLKYLISRLSTIDEKIREELLTGQVDCVCHEIQELENSVPSIPDTGYLRLGSDDWLGVQFSIAFSAVYMVSLLTLGPESTAGLYTVPFILFFLSSEEKLLWFFQDPGNSDWSVLGKIREAQRLFLRCARSSGIEAPWRSYSSWSYILARRFPPTSPLEEEFFARE